MKLEKYKIFNVLYSFTLVLVVIIFMKSPRNIAKHRVNNPVTSRGHMFALCLQQSVEGDDAM